MRGTGRGGRKRTPDHPGGDGRRSGIDPATDTRETTGLPTQRLGQAMYEFFEHTADVGLRVEAPGLPQLFAEAGQALFAVVVGDLERVVPRCERTIALEADGLEDLLHDWLTELLVLLDVDRLVLCQFDVSLSGSRLSAVVRGEPADPARHDLREEVKAVTYHGLGVERISSGWRAEVILDV